MKTNTVVIQSFRQYDVPCWLDTCMNSVRQWADLHSFTYAFIGDELFSRVPQWFRAKVSDDKTIMADLGRLEFIKDYLASGFDRVIWCDADVIIVRPDLFIPSPSMTRGFSKELWVVSDNDGHPQWSNRVNNSICFFCQEAEPSLSSLIATSITLVASSVKIKSNLIIGTSLLTRLHQQLPLPLISNTGLLSPLMIDAVCQSDYVTLEQFRIRNGEPIYAANLCNYFRHRRVSDAMFANVTSTLLRTGGAVLNERSSTQDA